jgi:competence protein ComEA
MADNPLPEPSPRNTIAAFIVVALALVAGAILLLATRPQPVQIVINPPVPTSTPGPTATPAPIRVYVSGAVVNPNQTITLPPNSRVEDAIDAAGGTTDAADLEKVNMAGILHDGDQVDVPAQGSQTALATPSGGVIVHINSATAAELDALPGVGPALAQRIVDYRESNGPFTKLEDLDAVSGIGPALLEQIKDLIAFDS